LKTAFDEDLSSYSPGSLLLRAITDSFDTAGIELLDSCADADDPLFSDLWSGRVPLATLLVPSGSAT